MRGNTAFMRMKSEIANTTSVQIVSPTSGVINHELESANRVISERPLYGL
jgi:hypothetical protein